MKSPKGKQSKESEDYFQKFRTFSGLLEIAKCINWDKIGQERRHKGLGIGVRIRKKNNKRAHQFRRLPKKRAVAHD